MKNRIIAWCILILLFYSCNSEKQEFTFELRTLCHDSGRESVDTLIKSYPYYDSTLYKEGEFKLYYSTGELKEVSTWSENYLINECRIFYKNGNLREYRFYSLFGCLCYNRSYNEDGTIIRSIGQPFVYCQSDYDSIIKVGNKVVSRIYIASPPNCIHYIYGIDGNGRYDVNWKRPQPYIYETTIRFDREGEFEFSFELEFEDTIKGIKRTYNGDVPYSVTK